MSLIPVQEVDEMSNIVRDLDLHWHKYVKLTSKTFPSIATTNEHESKGSRYVCIKL